MFRYRSVSVIFFGVFTATACAPRDTADTTVESGVLDTFDSFVDSFPPEGDSYDSVPVETGDSIPIDTAETGEEVVDMPTGIDTVILITYDTFRHDMTDAATSPNFNTWMDDGGTTLTSFWNSGNWTRTAMSSVITGMNGVDIGPELYLNQSPSIPTSITTLAETFTAAGWATYLDNSNNVWGSETEGGLRGYGTINETKGFYPTEGWKSAADQFDRAFDWMAETSGNKLVHVHTMDTHGPYIQLDASCKTEVDALNDECPIDVTADLNGLDMGGGKYTDEEIAACQVAIEAAHRCTATFLDASFGAFMDELDSSGMLEHAVVVVTDDHGEYWGERYSDTAVALDHHKFMYTPVSRGFAWIWWKGAAKQEVTQATSQIDIVPTILSLANVETDVAMDGSSVYDLPEGRVVMQFACDPYQAHHGAISADGSEHVILNNYYGVDDAWSMFDPELDPDEQDAIVEVSITATKTDDLPETLTSNASSDLIEAIQAQREATEGIYCQ